ncbi:putative receptor-like protein kinase At1g80870 [Punica granatum]|uniref:non-specific serine/threonine protein kinase n=2 Tax=Punica granatum TaxID=22663 RepID=A0A218WBV7_PUNGR|nr:putative receptor-like protein kinase At1g80870 [Punica granatum]OWM69562.1 hypothetical protein CDL15_Pgr014023 [Punica granatum]PKI40806.1 hypothetical protein CRG98_038817 [Punica granatum]
MPSRQLPPSPNLVAQPTSFARTKVLFLVLIISSSVVILLAVLYLLYHFYYSLLNRTRTIPFDSSTPLKLHRFSYRELRSATGDFDESNIVGKGGSGTVFRGLLRDGKSIAVKRLDGLSLETEREFQNELQILGGLRSPFLVTLLGYCVEKNKRILVYEYMPNRSLQESIFGEGQSGLSWEMRFAIILDVARALEFLHLGCDPPVIHGDVKPSNVLLDSDFRAKVSDFGLSRMKVEGEFGLDLFSQDLGRSQELWKSQELSGALAPETPVIGTPGERVDSPQEVDFALALQASSSSKTSRTTYNVKALSLNSANYNANIEGESDVWGGSGKGKEVSVVDIGCDEWSNKFVPYSDELFGFNRAKDVNLNACLSASDASGGKQWGKDWWWRQDGSGELCSKDYVMEWIGSQICPSTNPDWDDDDKKSIPEKTEQSSSPQLDRAENVNVPQVRHPALELDKNDDSKGENNSTKRHRKMQDWWKEERVAETRSKNKRKGSSKLRNLRVKWKKGFKLPHFGLGRRFHFYRRKKFGDQNGNDLEADGEFSFRRGWKKKSSRSNGSDMWSGDLFSRELSSTTSMRGTLCYVAPEYGGCGYLMEKADVYSLGVLILVIISGRRPLHVLASPMKLEKANLISWCRQLAHAGEVLELVDEKLKGEYNKEQASLCINLALTCLQKMPELRPDIGEIVKILKGEMDLPPVPFEFSPSPPSKLFGKSRRKEKASAD